MHMNDVQVPSQYEDRVFIGYDAESNGVIAHWMDSFGRKYSVPHGSGSITATTIQFVIPYSSGSFRDTLSFDAAGDSWTFVIEAEQPNGEWAHFAKYSM